MIRTRVAMLAALFTVGTAVLAACGHETAGAPAPQSVGGGAKAAESIEPGLAGSSNTSGQAALNVPAGQTTVADMRVAQGTQVYTCTSGNWTLLEPAAILRSGNSLALHTKGPQWISPTDGSAVTGAVVATVPKAGAIPELLLKSTANRGIGVFGSVDFVQRVNTEGGVAPAGSCTNGVQQAVPYSAEYRFYAPSNK
jgi:uncharacterized protein DUF3455